jgi:hypothetical protein
MTSFLMEPGASLIAFGGPVETVCNLPGRVRFRTQAVVGNESARNTLTENLTKLPFVHAVEVNLISGSILIQYAGGKLTPDVLLVAVLKLLDLEEQFLNPGPVRLQEELSAVGKSLNRGLHAYTAGWIDLRFLITVGFILMGVYKVRQEGFVASIPTGLTLLWWAYTSFPREAGRRDGLS